MYEEEQEEAEVEVLEVEVQAPTAARDHSYQEIQRMAITQTIDKQLMVNFKDPAMVFLFAIIVGGLVIKDNIVQLRHMTEKLETKGFSILTETRAPQSKIRPSGQWHQSKIKQQLRHQ